MHRVQQVHAGRPSHSLRRSVGRMGTSSEPSPSLPGRSAITIKEEEGGREQKKGLSGLPDMGFPREELLSGP